VPGAAHADFLLCFAFAVLTALVFLALGKLFSFLSHLSVLLWWSSSMSGESWKDG
jgi:hypothetical protein